MAQENVEVVRRAYDATNHGDYDIVESLFHPEVEFHTYGRSPEAGVYRGKEAVREYNENLFQQFESIRFEIRELVDAGDRVVVMTTQHAVPKGGQHEMNVEVAEVWVIRDGLLAERRSYSTRAEALEAAGLSESGMSQENVEAVHKLFAYWERGEWQASAELFDPDFEAVFSATAFPDPGRYRGARRTLDAWRRWLEAWEEFSLELEEAIGVGERVVALNRLRGRGKASGVAVDSEVGCLFDFNHGNIARMVFCDRQEALEAAGLSE